MYGKKWKFSSDYRVNRSESILHVSDDPAWTYEWEFGGWKDFPADEDGWIPTSHTPPEKGDYLCYSEEGFWGKKYWDGEKWMSTWKVEGWKPVVTPEKPERFVLEGVDYNDEICSVLDTEKDKTIVDCVTYRAGNEILEYLKENIE